MSAWANSLNIKTSTVPVYPIKSMVTMKKPTFPFILIQRYKKEKQLKKAKEAEMSNGIKFTGEGMEPTTFSQI